MNTLSAVGIGIAGAAAGYLMATYLNRIISRAKIKQSEQKVQEMLDSAKQQAESIKKEAALYARNNLLELRADFEKETKDRRQELVSLEKRLLQKEEYLEKKEDIISKKESDTVRRERNISITERNLSTKEEEYKKKFNEISLELQRVSGLTTDQAKQMLMDSVQEQAKHDIGKMLKQLEEEAQQTAEIKAKEIISVAVQRYSGEYAQEHTVTTVDLPNDEYRAGFPEYRCGAVR